MYDIRQFKPILYTLVLIGMIGFAVSAESPGAFVLSTALVLVNGWLVKTGRFRPLPRLVANGITLLALVYYGMQLLTAHDTPVLVIGQFLVALQIVKLYEQRGNRDYAQLLVLSLLLMVAAAISTASLLFGLLFIGYLFLSLYCCLLFHLKTEADAAAAAMTVASVRVAPHGLRHDERRLSVSMRRLTALVGAFAVVMALLVFLLFPRGTGANLLGPLQFRPSQALTGFSDQVSFQQVARITQNTQIVAHVQAWHNGKPMEGTRALLLRGLTLDVYGGNSGVGGTGPWQWSRSPQGLGAVEGDAGQRITVTTTASTDITRLVVTLQPTGSTALFTVGTPLTIEPSSYLAMRYGVRDRTLASREPLYAPLQYEVTCAPLSAEVEPGRWEPRLLNIDADPGPGGAARSRIDPRIAELAQRPEVSGANANGPLAAQRRGTGLNAVDGVIAGNIERYLQDNYAYTLDLTDARRLRDQDPVVGFLYDFKKGHCEYFAGAMTLLCQSLGMEARMVIGFKCDEYSNVGGYYIVRQSHAHAWVEVNTPQGWQVYDPTSGRLDERQAGGLLRHLKHFMDYLQFKWANHVVAYDSASRNNLLTQVDTRLVNSAGRGSVWLGRFKQWLELNVYDLSSRVLALVVLAMMMVLVIAVGWFVLERWKLRRRARRIGLDALPAPDRARLARQLGFYDDLLRLLARHQIARPAHLTPMEFSDSLSFLPSEAYHTVRRMTEMFYRIRFGGLRLHTDQQRRLNGVLARLGRSMPGAPPPETGP